MKNTDTDTLIASGDVAGIDWGKNASTGGKLILRCMICGKNTEEHDREYCDKLKTGVQESSSEKSNAPSPAPKAVPSRAETVLGAIGKGIKTWKKISDTTLPIIEEAMKFKEAPTVLGGTRMALRLHGHVSGLVEQYSGKKQAIITYENDNNWQLAFSFYSLNKQLWNQLIAMEHKMRQLFPDNEKYLELKIEGHVFGIIDNGSKGHLVYYQKDDVAGLDFLRDIFWQQFGTVLMLGKNEKGDEWEATRFDLNQSFETSTSSQYTREIIAYRAKGYTHSILFYGPPGTGKTNTAAQILGQCAHRTLILSKPTDMNIQWFQNNFPLLQPEAVLIEDIDHFEGSIPHLLAIIEYLNKNKVLVIATCNKVGVLDDALIRAGRFDEAVEIRSLPPDVIYQMLGGDVEIGNKVLDFPISAILDLKKRIEVLGRDEALNRMGDLEKRVKRSNSKKEYSLEEEAPKEKKK